MVATATATATATTVILNKVNPFVLEDTIKNIDELLSSSGDADADVSVARGLTHHCALPLQSNTGYSNGNGKGDATTNQEDLERNRPYLETAFNRIIIDDKKKKYQYRSPWENRNSSQDNSNNTDEDVDIIELETLANEVWDAYRQLYYGHDAIGSVFVRRKGMNDTTTNTSPLKKKTTTVVGSSSGSGSGGTILEAFFGIQKKCVVDVVVSAEDDDELKEEHETKKGMVKEIARWESVHCVTIEAPNYEDNTCEYTIDSQVWCRFQPEDVGDISKDEKMKMKQNKKKLVPTAPRPPAAAKPKKSKILDIARLEKFAKAADDWDSRHTKDQLKKTPAKKKSVGPPPPPEPAVVTSSAYYEKETTKVCRLLTTYTSKKTNTQKKKKKIPISSHLQNIGTLIEKIETELRSKIERVDIPKTCEAIQGMYRSDGTNNETSASHLLPGRNMHQHATGMGVGACLIGEISSKAKAKGFGGHNDGGETKKGDTGAQTTVNQAMTSMLAAEKKKLSDTTTTTSNNWKSGLKKTTGTRETHNNGAGSSSSDTATATATTTNDWKSSLKKTPAATTTTSATPEFLNFRNKLKSSTPSASATTTTPNNETN